MPTAPAPEGLHGCSADELRLLEAVRERLDGIASFHLSPRHTPIVCRQVQSRMSTRGLDHVDDYLRFLDQVPEERRILRDVLLIGSTAFFRDEEVFDALALGALAPLRREHARPLRVWVAGCSTGEEAYSLAIVMREYLEANADARALRIFATDLREGSVTHGRRGLYTQRACAGVTPHRRERFFVPASGGLQVVRGLRDQIVWGRHDLARDPPLPAMDLVSCRNVLLYSERAAQRHILAKLHYALRPGGLLLLGAAESVRAAPELFEPVAPSIRLYVRRPRPSFRARTAVQRSVP